MGALVLCLHGAPASAGDLSPARELFGGLPLELAIKEVRGKGTVMFAIFEDPTCTYCKALEGEVAAMNDVVIYRFLYPILSDEAVAPARGIWCARDRLKAWKAWVASGRLGAGKSCDSSAIDRVVELGRARKIRAVPAIFTATGERLPAATSRMELEMAISAPKVIEFQQSVSGKAR